jgi:hypothetical protein
VKSVDGSVIETHGSIKTNIREGNVEILIKFQLVSKQVYRKGEGILGQDFLHKMQAQICYRNRTLTFQHARTIIK